MIIDNRNDYAVEISDPYLTKDVLGNYVILQDETLIKHQTLMYSSEILVDDNPSAIKIFQMKLKGAVEKKWSF